MAVSKFGKTVLSNLFSKPATNMYPIKAKEFHINTRGHIQIDIEKCIFCGICSKKCPTDAIVSDRNEKYWSIDRLRCIQCNSCVDNCPKKCLLMATQYTAPSEGSIKDEFHARVPDNL